ncbi:MAG: hypothetical protein D6719_06675 [Candidatus Dadabacteria bacterium]|nr:MAG: hypothetical protein D6719_06675 [Candidatus Dadabacteria bacterium]
MKINHFCRLILFAAVTLVLQYAAPATSQAISLKEPQTGLTVDAPAGYSVSFSKGIYTLSKGKLKIRLMLARSPFSLSDTVKSYLKAARIKRAKKRGKGDIVKIQGKLHGKSVVVMFRKAADAIEIATLSGSSGKGRVHGNKHKHKRKKRKKHKKRKKRKRSHRAVLMSATYEARPLTVADVLNLARILRSRRGGRTVPLQLKIPMRKYVAPDRGSSALVPDMPGWKYTGGGGVVAGGNPAQGGFALGVPVTVTVPGFSGQIVNPLVPPDRAIIEVWPKWVALGGDNLQVLSVRAVPGTNGWLGPNFFSALYAVRFTVNGVRWQGLMASGVFDIGTVLGWGWYHSYIAVPENGPGGFGPALIDTWASWDNSKASEQRLAQAIQTILNTHVQGWPIDPDVFQHAANAWDAYIRE